MKKLVFMILAAFLLIAGCSDDRIECDPIDRINDNLPSYLLHSDERELPPEEFFIEQFGTVRDEFENKNIQKY